MSFASFFRWLFRRGKKKAPENGIETVEEIPVVKETAEEAAVPELRAEELPAPVSVCEPEPAPVSEPETPEEPVSVPEIGLAPVQAADEAAPETCEEPEPEISEEPTAVPPLPVLTAKGGTFIKTRYNRSFTARLIQANDAVKGYYSEIKNELLSYGVKSRISWKYETFRLGRKLLVKLVFRGKSLYVYLALDPAAYADSKYKIKDVSQVASNASVPTLYKIKNARRCKYVKELIAAVMAENAIGKGETPLIDYATEYPYEEIEQLIARQLVKVLLIETDTPVSEADDFEDDIEEEEDDDDELEEEPVEEVIEEEPVEEVAEEIVEEESVEEVIEEIVEEEAVKQVLPEEVKESVSVHEAEANISDEEAEEYVNVSRRVSDKAKKAIVNIDTLGKYFKKGERVTVEEIIKRVPEIGKKVTYIKVLARGTLDKALTVEADDFSPAAIKMIVLTGGKVIRTKKG